MLNIGVVGCGYWGPNLIRNFMELPDANLSVCCDMNEERLSGISKRYPAIKTTKNYTGILQNAEVEAIVLATPISTHYKLAKEALLNNKHVLVEKPLAMNSTEAQDLVRISKKQGRTLMVSHTFNYTPAVNKIKELIKGGDLGEIYYLYSQRLNLGLFQKDCNVIWDLAPHDISILLYLLEEEPVYVSAKGNAHVQKGKEDVAFLTLTFSKNRTCYIHVSWLDPCKTRRLVVVGNKKMIVYDDIEPIEKVKIYEKNVSSYDEYTTFGEFQLSYNYGDIQIPKLSTAEPLKIECQHFIDCIKNGVVPKSGGEAGLSVVKVLEAASTSLKKGGLEVELK